jgi:hypothetical protein
VNYIDFVTIPYLSEAQRQLILRKSYQTGMQDKIRIIFTIPRPLSWQFRSRQETFACHPNCMACLTSCKENSCHRKNAVYNIKCLVCQKISIGQTSRTMRSRILEHMMDSNSYVNQHMALHPHELRRNFQWKIVATHLFNTTRLAIEAIHINRSFNEWMCWNNYYSFSLMKFSLIL